MRGRREPPEDSEAGSAAVEAPDVVLCYAHKGVHGRRHDWAGNRYVHTFGWYNRYLPLFCCRWTVVGAWLVGAWTSGGVRICLVKSTRYAHYLLLLVDVTKKVPASYSPLKSCKMQLGTLHFDSLNVALEPTRHSVGVGCFFRPWFRHESLFASSSRQPTVAGLATSLSSSPLDSGA